jgi:hypothetical protein
VVRCSELLSIIIETYNMTDIEKNAAKLALNLDKKLQAPPDET